MPSILFVCTANICRSPMAEVVFKHKLAERPDAAQWQVASAGTWGLDGRGAATSALIALHEIGLDAGKHVARTVTLEMLRSSDLILTMENNHKEALQVEFPEIASRVFLMTEMAGFRSDVKDPIAGTQDDFRATLQELDRILTKGMDVILELAVKNAEHRASLSG